MALLLILLVPLACAGCPGNPITDPSEPAFSAANFSVNSTLIDNPYHPLVPGTVGIHLVDGEDGLETVVVEVLDITRLVNGIICVVVRDRVYIDELLIEDTHDWFAQDDSGNVWYMGEEVVNYEYDEEGNVIATDSDGAWEAGVDGAVPGIQMKATLVVGDTYQQEFYAGEAEDMAAIHALNVPVTLANGMAYSCLQTREWTPLEPGVVEYKYYAPGIGQVAEEKVDGSDRGELTGTFNTGPGSLPDFSAAAFSNPTQLTNTYLPFSPGNAYEYVQETEDGTERIIVEVLPDTRVVNGIDCRVVRDRVFLDDVLIEDTHDWYAQDDAGNVWYMGEEVTNYEYDDEGNLIGTDSDGAWESGVDDAEAGIVMWVNPIVGESYRQEFYEDEAEDMAMVAAMGVTVELSDGVTYENCLKILEWSPLDPGVLEYKYYASGVGVVLEQPLGADAPVELVSGP